MSDIQNNAEQENQENENAPNPFEIAARRALEEGTFLSEEEERKIQHEEHGEESEPEDEDDGMGDEESLDGSEWEEDLVDENAGADESDDATETEWNELELSGADEGGVDAGGEDDGDLGDMNMSGALDASLFDEAGIFDEEGLLDADAADEAGVAAESDESHELDQPAVESFPGTITLVGVPIGNRDDITMRALRTLQAVDVVVCDDYKGAARLLRIYNISKKLIEITNDNQDHTIDEVVRLLRAGKRVAAIAHAGLPFLVDATNPLMRKLYALGVQPRVVPGVSTVMTGLMASGFGMKRFDFIGFLPRRPEERRRAVEELADRDRTLVILESPLRVRSLLAILSEVMPDRRAAIAINLTTPFEATIRGTLGEMSEKFARKKLRGEFVLVLDRAPRPAREERAQIEEEPEFPHLIERESDFDESIGDESAGHELEIAGESAEEPTGWQRPGRGERPEPGERPERPERGARPERGEGWSPVKKTRGDRPGGWERAERGERPERRDRPERGDRPERRERPDRGDRPERRDFGGRPERGERREGGWNRGPRPERRDFGGRGNDRGGDRGGRFERREGGERFERREGAERREFRPERRDDRGGRPERRNDWSGGGREERRGAPGGERGGWRREGPPRREGWGDRPDRGFDRGGRDEDRPRRDFGGREGGREGGGNRGGGFGGGGNRGGGFGGGNRGGGFGGGGGSRGPRRDFGGNRGGGFKGKKGGR